MDAYETRKKNWEDLDVTRDELKNFTECLKQEEFRKLLIEYADEVSNPENRKLYEEEITQLEKERGVDVTFVNPEPGYVIKTSVNGEKKCFVNISKSDKVGKPSSQPSYTDGNRGLEWSIPYSLAPPREDYDKKHVRCTVFDVVFHSDTLYLASKNPRFADIVNGTAMDAVETNFKVALDRKNMKFPKMSFKGASLPTVIRKACEKPEKPSIDIEPEIYQKLMSSYDECRESRTKKNPEKPQRAPPSTKYYRSDEKSRIVDDDSMYVVPKFTIKHQSDVDLQEFRDSIDAKFNAAIPNRLVIVIDLPLLRTASDAQLDVQERSLVVFSEKPARYKLELPLPYSVDADAGTAKFDGKYKKLTVTLPVVRKNMSLADIVRDDSGVESDHGSPLISSSGDDDIPTISSSIDDDSSRDENPESRSHVQVLGSDEDANNRRDDNALRTNDSNDTKNLFLNPNIKYTLPPFICNVYDDNLALTVNVKNVDKESINYRTLVRNAGIHIVLSSVGAGFFPVYYSLCLKIHDNSIISDTINVEPWDNNVVFTVRLNDADTFTRYLVGTDEEFMEAKDLTSRISLTEKFHRLVEEPQIDRDKKIEVIAEGEDIVINIETNNLDSDDEDDRRRSMDVSSRKKERKHGLIKSRSVSESSGDELPSSNASSVSKGILKSRRGTFSRSVSESSIDDTAGHVSSVDFHYDSIHDINSESDCSSFKKSVRFNDVVSRQLYRSNSSILGQRKKNQRKLRNKKRANERRMSESENSETEEREKYRVSAKCESANEDNSHDNNVKPILNRDKLSEKTENIEIEKCPGNRGHKTKPDESVLVDVHKTNDVFSGKNPAGTEFKNDLIFDLDM